jgi:hypothetical protein
VIRRRPVLPLDVGTAADRVAVDGVAVEGATVDRAVVDRQRIVRSVLDGPSGLRSTGRT